MNRLYLYLILISFLFLSCSKNDKEDNAKVYKKEMVTITLEKDDDDNIVIKGISIYDEEAMKESALLDLKTYLGLPYSEDGVNTAYEMFYSKNYKDILARTRNIKNVDEYIESNPSLDFEFHITINKVNDIIVDGNSVIINSDTTIYDRVSKVRSKANQTFTMTNENNKWVIKLI